MAMLDAAERARVSGPPALCLEAVPERRDACIAHRHARHSIDLTKRRQFILKRCGCDRDLFKDLALGIEVFHTMMQQRIGSSRSFMPGEPLIHDDRTFFGIGACH
jgi:hypothetical protein